MKVLVFLIICNFNLFGIHISYISTVGKCGIATCTKHICDELNKLGHNANIIDSLLPAENIIEEISKNNSVIINLQYSATTMRQDIMEVVDWAKKQNIKIILTVHENYYWLPSLIDKVDKVILFNDQIMENNDKYILIPHAVPNFENLESRSKLRKKYGFKENDIIISTFGFMIDWKKHDVIIAKFKKFMDRESNIRLQLLTSTTDRFDLSEQKIKIKRAISKSGHSKKIIHITDFLPEAEINERLYLSDIGYLWGDKNYAKSLGENPNTTSGAHNQFVSARLPLVVVDCPHYHDCNSGVIKTTENMDLFIKKILSTLKNKNLLNKLRAEMEIKFQNNCIKNLIHRHIKTFEEVLNQ